MLFDIFMIVIAAYVVVNVYHFGLKVIDKHVKHLLKKGD